MVFQTIGENIIRDFTELDDATRYFFNPTVSGARCRLYAITVREAPGEDGKFCSVELLEARS